MGHRRPIAEPADAAEDARLLLGHQAQPVDDHRERLRRGGLRPRARVLPEHPEAERQRDAVEVTGRRPYLLSVGDDREHDRAATARLRRRGRRGPPGHHIGRCVRPEPGDDRQPDHRRRCDRSARGTHRVGHLRDTTAVPWRDGRGRSDDEAAHRAHRGRARLGAPERADRPGPHPGGRRRGVGAGPVRGAARPAVRPEVGRVHRGDR